jgi:hypothetical protein
MVSRDMAGAWHRTRPFGQTGPLTTTRSGSGS